MPQNVYIFGERETAGVYHIYYISIKAVEKKAWKKGPALLNPI